MYHCHLQCTIVVLKHFAVDACSCAHLPLTPHPLAVSPWEVPWCTVECKLGSLTRDSNFKLTGWRSRVVFRLPLPRDENMMDDRHSSNNAISIYVTTTSFRPKSHKKANTHHTTTHHINQSLFCDIGLVSQTCCFEQTTDSKAVQNIPITFELTASVLFREHYIRLTNTPKQEKTRVETHNQHDYGQTWP